jgi:hypothetical protein
MATARGYQEKLLMVFEDTFNTTPTVTAGDSVSLPFHSGGLSSSEDIIGSEIIRYGRRDEAAPSFGNINVSGDYVIPIDKTNIGYWLKLMFGVPVTTGAGPYTHKFKPGNNNPSVTVEGGFADINSIFRWAGVKAQKMSMEFSVNKELSATMSLLGCKETTDTDTFDATPVEETITKFQAKSIVLKQGGSAVATAMTCTVEIDNGLAEDLYTLSSNGQRVELPEGKLMVTAKAEMLFRDLTYYNLALNNTETSIEIIATNGTNEFSILMPEVVFPRQPVTRNGHGPVKYTLDMKAYWQDSVGSYPIQITLKNDKASYA